MRPEFVTDADIVRWDEHIDSDVELQKVLNGTIPARLREVLRACRWLTEEMTSREISEFEIAGMQHALGVQSHGADPWQVAQEIRNLYIEIIASEKS